MSSVGYRTGDIIAIKRTPDAAEGDVVMARIGTEITLKCFHRPADERVELKPCSGNPEHRPDRDRRANRGLGDRRRGRRRDDRTAATRALQEHESRAERVRKTHCRRLPGPFRGAVWPAPGRIEHQRHRITVSSYRERRAGVMFNPTRRFRHAVRRACGGGCGPRCGPGSRRRSRAWARPTVAASRNPRPSRVEREHTQQLVLGGGELAPARRLPSAGAGRSRWRAPRPLLLPLAGRQNAVPPPTPP